MAASVVSVDSRGTTPAVFTLNRVGNLASAINVAYTIGGTAQSGVDYAPVSGVASFAAGASTATVTLTPRVNSGNLNNRTATLTLIANRTYGVAAAESASVSFFYNSGALYVSNLRTPSTVMGSTANGTGTILLAPDEKSAYINVSFSNLSSPQVLGYLYIDVDYLLKLP